MRAMMMGFKNVSQGFDRVSMWTGGESTTIKM